MGQFLSIGQTVSSLSISRANVDVGQTGVCVLLDPRVLAKQVAFFEGFGYVELGADDIARYGKQPSTLYLMLVLRLTDFANGKVFGDSVEVQYLRMTQRQYNAFSMGVQANPSANVVWLSKERNVNADGKDVSQVVHTPGVLELSMAVQQRLQLMQADPRVVEGLFAQVDSITGRSSSDYAAWLASRASQAGVGQAGVIPSGGVMAPAAPIPTQAPPQVIRGGGYYQQGAGQASVGQPRGGQPSVGQPSVVAAPPAQDFGAPVDDDFGFGQGFESNPL